MSHPNIPEDVNDLQQGLKPTADFGIYSNANWPLNDRKWNYWEYQGHKAGTFSSTSRTRGFELLYSKSVAFPSNAPYNCLIGL